VRCMACKRMAATKTGLCVNCDPERRTSMAAARRLGGVRRRRGAAHGMEPVGFQCPQDLLAVLERIMNDTLRLDNSPARSRAVGGLVLAALKVFETAELVERMRAIEARLSSGRGGAV